MVIESFGATVRVNGLQLTSAIDREAEARALAGRVPDEADEAWVYGPALGDTVRVLLQRPALRTLHVAVLTAELTRALVTLPDDPRVVVHPPGDVAEVFGPFVVSPAELRLADAAALPLRDRLRAVLDQPYREFSARTLAPRFAAHEAANVARGDPPVAVLCTGEMIDEAIVVCGGPTAAARFPWARTRGVPIIAASTALLPLLRAGVTPDVVGVLDRLPVMVRHLPVEGSPEAARLHTATALVYHVAAAPAVPERWRGPRYVMRDGDFEPGGSVSHVLVDLARRMGARVVHLLGFDCCYPGAQSHVEGAAGAYEIVEATKLRTIDGRGEWALTDEALTLYHRTMEEWIGRHPEVRVVKYGRAGVTLAGAEWGEP